MAGKLSLDEFKKRLDTEPKLKAELSQKLQAVLKDMGIQDQDVNNLARTQSEDELEAVFVSTRDSKKNSRSIIIF